MKRLLVATGILLALSVSAPAQESIELTIGDAIGSALERNLLIREKKVFADKAGADVQAARGSFDPSVMLQYRRTYQKDATFSALMSPEEETAGYSMSVGGKVPTGTRYELRYSSTEVEQSEDFIFLTENPYHSNELTLSLRQPLLKGFGPAAQTAQVRSARKTHEAARLEYGRQVAVVVMEVTGAYWDLYYVRENLTVAKRSLELAESLLREVEGRIRAGALPQVELYNAEAEVALRRERLLAARKAVMDAEDVLRAQMDSSDWDNEIIPVSEPPVPVEPVQFEELMRSALENRWDYRSALAELQARETMAAYQKNQKLPSFDVVAGAGLSGMGESSGAAQSELEGGDYYSWNLGVELSFPLGNRTARGNYQRAWREAEEARLRVEQVKKSIVVELREAIRAVELARQSIEATGQTREAMEKRLASAQERFRLGMSTLNEVLSFEEEHAEALSSEIRARTDHAKAAARLRKASGTLYLQSLPVGE